VKKYFIKPVEQPSLNQFYNYITGEQVVSSVTPLHPVVQKIIAMDEYKNKTLTELDVVKFLLDLDNNLRTKPDVADIIGTLPTYKSLRPNVFFGIFENTLVAGVGYYCNNPYYAPLYYVSLKGSVYLVRSTPVATNESINTTIYLADKVVGSKPCLPTQRLLKCVGRRTSCEHYMPARIEGENLSSFYEGRLLEQASLKSVLTIRYFSRFITMKACIDNAQHNKLSISVILKLLEQLLEILAVYHQVGFFHNDISWDNIMLRLEPGNEQAVFIDYGNGYHRTKREQPNYVSLTSAFVKSPGACARGFYGLAMSFALYYAKVIKEDDFNLSDIGFIYSAGDKQWTITTYINYMLSVILSKSLTEQETCVQHELVFLTVLNDMLNDNGTAQLSCDKLLKNIAKVSDTSMPRNAMLGLGWSDLIYQRLVRQKHTVQRFMLTVYNRIEKVAINVRLSEIINKFLGDKNNPQEINTCWGYLHHYKNVLPNVFNGLPGISNLIKPTSN